MLNNCTKVHPILSGAHKLINSTSGYTNTISNDNDINGTYPRVKMYYIAMSCVEKNEGHHLIVNESILFLYSLRLSKW